MDSDGPSGSTEIDLKRFDPSMIKPHRIVVAIGKRGTGKSILLRDLMYSQRDKIEYAIAMSPTREASEGFRRVLPPTSVYDEYDGDVVTQMLELQRERANTSGMNSLRNLALVLDDCMYDKTVMKSKTMRNLFMNGRHYKCFFLAAVQWLMDLGPDLRTQVDYVFALRENILSNRERLYKYFFGIFPKYEDFSRVFDACTANYECLVIDNTVNSNNVEDCIFWYKASVDIPDFRMCAPVYWELDRKRGGGTAPGDNQEKAKEGAIAEPSVVATRPTRSAPRLRRIVKHKGGALPGIPERVAQ